MFFLTDIDLNQLKREEMRRMRSRMQLVFQDPLASLNPRMTIGQAILHPVTIHLGNLSKAEQRQRVLNILTAVGMNPPESFYDLFPHQISGGQRQRIVLARALVTNPELIVADEPIAMADVSVRALLLDLMMKLKKEVRPDLPVHHPRPGHRQVRLRPHRHHVPGQAVEMGDLHDVYSRPLHPYTQALLAAVPVPDPKKRRTQELPKGEIPNPIDPPTGCRFHPRCMIAKKVCSREVPPLRELLPGHTVACHFAEQFSKT